MQLTALVGRTDHVCCRYRLTAFAPALAQAGHTLRLQVLPRRWWGRLGVLHRLRNADVVLQRRLLPRWEIALLRRTVRRLLFDFDDAVFLRDSYAPRGAFHERRLRRFAATVAACDAVLAGNAFLAAQAAHWTDSGRVHVIPTCVNPARYPPAAEPGPADGVELVWIGSAGTLRGLEQMAPLLEELGRRFPQLRLKVICDRFPRLTQLRVIRCPWNEADEAAALTSAAVGVSLVPDDLWSRGKCGLKVLQYMAAGLPVVANPVGVQAELVRDGVTGYLARTPAQWLDAVGRLARDPELRRRMGRAGRERLEAEYSVAVGARRWLDVLAALERRDARSA